MINLVSYRCDLCMVFSRPELPKERLERKRLAEKRASPSLAVLQLERFASLTSALVHRRATDATASSREDTSTALCCWL